MHCIVLLNKVNLDTVSQCLQSADTYYCSVDETLASTIKVTYALAYFCSLAEISDGKTLDRKIATV